MLSVRLLTLTHTVFKPTADSILWTLTHGPEEKQLFILHINENYSVLCGFVSGPEVGRLQCLSNLMKPLQHLCLVPTRFNELLSYIFKKRDFSNCFGYGMPALYVPLNLSSFFLSVSADIVHENLKMGSDGESDHASGTSSDEVQSPTGVCLRNRGNRRISAEVVTFALFSFPFFLLPCLWKKT